MIKGNRKMLARILSVVLAAGMSVTGLPVGAMAAEIEDAAAQQEAVIEQETAEEVDEEAAEEQEEAAEQEAAVEAATEETAEEADLPEQEEQKEEDISEESEVPAAEGETAEAADVEEETVEEAASGQEAADEIGDLAVTGEIEDVITNAKKDGFYDDEYGNTYYYINDEPVYYKVIKIGGDYYGFDYDGIMYRDRDFWMWDDEGGNYFPYCAGSDGKLLVNTWSEFGDYYYGENGRGAHGLLEVDGVLHVFEYGMMRTGGTYKDDTGLYKIDYDGVATKFEGLEEGWNKLDGHWYYIVDGDIVSDKVMQIGSSWYGFDYDGMMYAGERFSIFDYDTYESNYYCARGDGSLYVNTWYTDSDGNRYYYGAKGVGVNGIVKFDGKNYMFDNGELDINGTCYYEGSYYISDGNGIAKKVEAGWNQSDGFWYYYDKAANSFYKGGVYTIGSAKYGFDWDGHMYSDQRFDTYDHSIDEWVFYRATSSGALFTGGWLSDEGYWYYYDTDGKEYRDGKKTVGGKSYYFDWEGRMLEDDYIVIDDILYYANTSGVLSQMKSGLTVTDDGTYYVEKGAMLREKWKQVNGKWYYFGYDGRAAKSHWTIGEKSYFFDANGVMLSNTWAHEYSSYYAQDDGSLAVGEKQIGGKWYYFNEYGEMLTGAIRYNGKTQLYGKDGVWIMELKKDNGWTSNSGNWYYFENGEMVSDELKVIGGKTYYFGYSGIMISNDFYDEMVFDQNGARVESGWYQYNGAWVYVDPATHQLVQGEQTIKGKKYYFNGRYMTTGERVVNGELRTYGTDGALKSSTKLNQNGWTLFNGIYYYYKNGEPFTGWVGNYYVVDGRMQTDTVINGYYVNDVGLWVQKTGWVDDNQKYVKSNGKIAMKEWVQIGGSWYYFNSYGSKRSYDTLTEGTKQYAFDTTGKLVLTVDKTKKETKWVSAGGNWYYILNGALLKDGEHTISGATYYFDYSGIMAKNEFSYEKYYGSDGKLCKYTGWQKIDGKWFWFGNDNRAEYGWITIGGKTYYILYSGGMATGSKWISGKLYTFDSNGVLTSTEKTQNGWVKKGSDWYYFKNGEMAYSCIKTINGVTYGFTSTGKMAVNEPVRSGWGYNNVYFADGSGKVVFSKAWRKIDGEWYYFGDDGKLLTGLHIVDGKLYNLPSILYYYE